jgi:hypothetical protein
MRLAVVPPSVAFLAIIQMLDQLIIYLGTRVDTDLSFTIICEYIFYPIAWLVISVVVVWPAAIVCKHARKGLVFPNTCAPKSGACGKHTCFMVNKSESMQPRKLQAVKSIVNSAGATPPEKNESHNVVLITAAIVCKHARKGLAFPNTCAPKSGACGKHTCFMVNKSEPVQSRKLRAVKSIANSAGATPTNPTT